jgi:DNA-binding PucR family transcriptional regulator
LCRAHIATDDAHHARLRETLFVFLDTGGSYKTTAERLLLHKNTVQYRIRKAEESLGRPVGGNRHDVETRAASQPPARLVHTPASQSR